MTAPIDESLVLWDQAADRYVHSTGGSSDFQVSTYLPVVDKMIGDVKGKTILDAGCGNGRYAKRLAAMGATVTGIDGSKEMVRMAWEENPDPSITYSVMDLTRPLPVESRTFDIVLANMVLMDLPEIATSIGEFSRVLKSDGSFIFSITHPSFFCSEWARDETGARSYKRVSDYLGEKKECLNFWGPTLHYHRPLSRYIHTLETNGLCVISLHEPVPDIRPGKRDPDVLSNLRIPSFMVIKAAHVPVHHGNETEIPVFHAGPDFQKYGTMG
ncbi:MAG: methyltransferase domain-containing protein [Methanoregula sp.]|nr:methyltransferase domain-containing protein [Methanoregula sp.]